MFYKKLLLLVGLFLTLSLSSLSAQQAAQVGVQLSTSNGTWNNCGSCTYTYQWIDSSTGAISGGTAQTYTPVAGNVGHTLTVQVTAHNSSGPSLASTSVATATVAAAGTGFTVSGGQFFNPSGQQWVGRGIKLTNASLSAVTVLRNMLSALPATTPMSTAFPGINFLQIPFVNADFATIKPYIDALTAAGIVVCLQDDVESEFGLAQPISPITDGNLTTSTNFVASWATTYKNNPYVWFTSMNEPELYTPNKNYPPIAAEEMAYYNAVRGTGNNNIFIIEAAGNANGVTVGDMGTTFNSTFNAGWDFHDYGNLDSNSTDINAMLSAIANLVSIYSAIHNVNGVMPSTIMEYGDQCCFPGGVDPNWMQVVQGVNTAPNIQVTAAFTWETGQSGGDNLTNSPFNGSSLTAFGTMVKGYISSGHKP